MINKIIKSTKAAILVLSLSSTLYGEYYGDPREYYKGYEGTLYEDQPGEYYTWIQVSNLFLQDGNVVSADYFSSIQEATQFANSVPEITHFYYVGPDGVWTTQGIDYATDTLLLHADGYAEFFSGGGGVWHRADGTHGYFKQSVIPRPENYAQEELRTYLEIHPEILSPDAAPYLEINTSLEDAFKIADNDPLITHFIVMERDNYFHLTYFNITLGGKTYTVPDRSIEQSKNTIVFFQKALPSWLNINYSGGIWIYSKK